MFLLFASAILYEKPLRILRHRLFPFFALGLPALLLTFSRASWFSFLLGFLFIAVWIHRDRRVLVGFLVCVMLFASYVGLSGLKVRFLSEAPGQTMVERFYETFSAARWKGEYYGLGRVFWFVQTPLSVIPASPIFGFGPGQYGGGVVAALRNTKVYEQLGLPFGVFGTDGYIDNSWFSLWGEAGTLGLALYVWMYATAFFYAVRLYRRSRDGFTRALALGFAASLIAVAFASFLSTLLEVRTTAYYIWLYAGAVFVLGERERIHLPVSSRAK